MKPHKNSRHVIEIKSVTEKGFGVGDIGGFVSLVDGALPGEKIDTLVVKVKKNYGYGKLVQIVTASPFRIKPACRVAEQCGGCQFQHCDYSAQLGFKKQFVQDALEKIGGLSEPPVLDVIGMENPARYRNKAVFPVVPLASEQKQSMSDTRRHGFAIAKSVIGMYAPRSHRIIEIDDCGIQHEAHVGVLAAVREHMRRRKISAYDEVAHKGLVRHIVIRTSLATGEIMVVLVANGRTIPKSAELVEKLAALGVTTILVNENTAKTNTIFGEGFEILHGTGIIREKIGDILFELSAPSFFQVNPVQTNILYETAISRAGLDGSQCVIDAHCGVGTVALFAARRAKSVLGVDIVQAAVADAKKNAALNGITNAEFICGAAEAVLPEIMTRPGEAPDVIFLDPPRKGCDRVLLDAIIAARIPRVVYISCDPATLARDVKILAAGGYAIAEVQPVDMFPFTGKVECVSVLRRTNTGYRVVSEGV